MPTGVIQPNSWLGCGVWGHAPQGKFKFSEPQKHYFRHYGRIFCTIGVINRLNSTYFELQPPRSDKNLQI